MTTKPKTRKAPVAKRAAPKAATKQASGEPKRKVSGIRNLVSRWHWLEADQTHCANIAQTEKESERLIAIHNNDQEEIESALAQVAPKSFLDAVAYWNSRSRGPSKEAAWLTTPKSTCSRMG